MAVSGVADQSNLFGFTDKSIGNKGYRTSNVLAEDNNYGNINDMDTRLSALNGTYFTVARLQQMNLNDKVYALRLLSSDAGTIG